VTTSGHVERSPVLALAEFRYGRLTVPTPVKASVFDRMALALALVAAMLTIVSCGSGAPQATTAPGEAAQDATTTAAPDEHGKVKVVYENDAIKPENRDAVELIRKSGVLEQIADWTTETVALPHDMEMRVSDDMPEGVLAPIAEPDGRTIQLPASFFAQNYDVLSEFVAGLNKEGGPPSVFPEKDFNADVLTPWAEQYIVAHEMGHALVHQLLLPTTGLEEDAVDAFAAFFTINNVGAGPALGAAALFDELASDAGDPAAEDYASDHPITKQRVYNFLCFLAGEDEKLAKSLVDEGYLPDVRAPVCPLEWAQLDFGWWTTLEPHFNEAFSAEGTELQQEAREELISQTKAFAAELKRLRGQ
jgi:putative metallopeptidase DUF4344